MDGDPTHDDEQGDEHGDVEEGIALRWEDERRLAFVTLRGGRGNRFSLARIERMARVVERLWGEPSLRAVCLRADGPDFSFGADLGDPALAARMAQGMPGHLALARQGQRLVGRLCDLPVPTVVAARGRAIGAGGCVFLSCDFRFVAPDFSLRFPEVDRGMHLSWAIAPRMARELGVSAARRLSLGGEALSAADFAPSAVQVAADPDAAAEAAARAMARKPPLAVRAIKETFVRLDRRDRVLVEDDPARFAATTASEDFGEAIAAWMEGREGAYRGR